jgi:hypothetical protein
MSGRHGVQYVAKCVGCAALTPVVWQSITNLSTACLHSARIKPSVNSPSPQQRGEREFFIDNRNNAERGRVCF